MGSGKVFLKSEREIALMRDVNLIVAEVLDACEAACAVGVSTWDLNQIADKVMKKAGATSAFLGYHGYPAVLCTSVNEVVVHGIPRKDVVLKEGDIIGIDFGCFLQGYCGDSARTIAIGKVSAEAQGLMDATRESLDKAIEQCVPGNRLGDVGWAVQGHVEPLGYSVVRSFVGHGIGRSMHEAPSVPNFGTPGKGQRLSAGMVIAIEPMVNLGTHEVEVLADQWTAVTTDRRISAHFEHSIAITSKGPFVLSRPSSVAPV